MTPVFQLLREQPDATTRRRRRTRCAACTPTSSASSPARSPRKRTRILMGWNSGKYYHGDLMERAMCLFLALTGNWGKKGTGARCWAVGMFDGMFPSCIKSKPGPRMPLASVFTMRDQDDPGHEGRRPDHDRRDRRRRAAHGARDGRHGPRRPSSGTTTAAIARAGTRRVATTPA